MNKIFALLFVVISFLYAQNPKIYAALGDIIYNNVDKIDKLQIVPEFSAYQNDIQNYVKKVQETKKMGFAIENGDKTIDRKEYLNRLRKLSQKNDFFTRAVDVSFKTSLENQNSALFDNMINSGLLQTQKYKKDIIDYYFKHSDELNTTGLIQKYLDEDARLRAKQKAQKKHYKTKRERELERIRRIRLKDKLEQEKLERELEEKLRKKKLEIREYQKKELSKTI